MVSPTHRQIKRPIIKKQIMKTLKNELSKNIFGIKYYNLNEYDQDLIKDEIKGLKDLMKDIENKGGY